MMRSKLGSPFALVLGAAALVVGTTGCNPHPLKPVETDIQQENETQLRLTVNKDVDVLFVIDNSGSMGEEQANLAQNFDAFIDTLEAEGVEANYRIGVTTTDNGNPRCQPGVTTPEGGQLQLSPCTSRPTEFQFGTTVDVYDLACGDICTLTDEQLEIQPTITDEDPVPSPRKWLENIEGRSNLPEGTDTAAAFACFGPQGVAGCGFESTLESMNLALSRALTDGEPEFGFLRASAILAIVIVTDEADCSHNKDYDTIFEPDGEKTFWFDPEADQPTSAVCWNAGVECTGPTNAYESCVVANKGVNGNVLPEGANAAQDAVLHPISRYIDRVQGIETDKQTLNADQEVIVALIGGVADDGSIFYADSIDPEFQEDFGIGPGCSVGETNAVPPVRLAEFTNAFSEENWFSVCSPDYTPALQAVADRITDQIQPACYGECVRDTDESTPDIVDPECTVEERPLNEDPRRVPECARDGAGAYEFVDGDYVMPSDDDNVCYAMLIDTDGQTPDPNDDMSDFCNDRNFNLEFQIARRVGFPAAGGTAISATCSLADFSALECPNLGAEN